MKRAALVLPVAVVVALLLAGCTGTEEPAGPTATPKSTAAAEPSTASTDDAADPDATPTPDSASYATAADLQTAAVAAGLDCDDPATVKAVAPATSAVSCEDLTLSVYATAADRDTVVNAALADEDSTRLFLVGANWLIEAPDGNSGVALSDLIAGLGGFVVPQGS